MHRCWLCRLLVAAALTAIATVLMAGPSTAVTPEVNIIVPANGTVTQSPTIEIAGNVTPGSSLQVAGLLLFVAPDGSWSVRVALVQGLNMLRADAWDAGANQTTATVNVTFENPAAALAADLQDAMDEINATNDALDFWQERQSETEADLAEALALIDALNDSLMENLTRVEILEGELSATQDDLAATQDNLAATQDDLSSTQEELDVTQANVSGAVQHLEAAQNQIDEIQADLAATDAELSGVSAAQEMTAARAEKIEASAGLATMIGVVGVILGVAGIAAAMWMGRTRRSKEGGD